MTTETGKKNSGQSLEAVTKDDVDGPPSGIHPAAPVTEAGLRAFLGLRETQERIHQIVRARLDKRTPGHIVEEVIQNANIAALTATSRPQTMGTARGWLGTVTARTVVNHFRREAVDRKWLVREVEIEELPPEGEPTGPFVPDWLVTTWLAPRMAGDPRLQETYQLLCYKAETEKTLAQVAEDHGMTEGALKSRIHALKTKYEPQWKRRERMRLWLLFFCIAAIAAVAWLLWPPEQSSYMPGGSTTPNLDRFLGGPQDVGSAPPGDPSAKPLPARPSAAPSSGQPPTTP